MRLSEQYSAFEKRQGGSTDKSNLENLRERIHKRISRGGKVSELGGLIAVGSGLSNAAFHLSSQLEGIALAATGVGIAATLGGIMMQGSVNHMVEPVDKYMRAHHMLDSREQSSWFDRYVKNYPEQYLAGTVGLVGGVVFIPHIDPVHFTWGMAAEGATAGAAAGLVMGLIYKGARNLVDKRNKDRF